MKNRLLAHAQNLTEYKDKRFSYLTFDENVGTVKLLNFDDEAFLFSEVAKILLRDIFAKDCDGFDGHFSENTQKENVPASKRVRQNQTNTKTQRAKSRESPLGVYLGMMIHAKTRERTLVDTLYSLGISVSYGRVMELSTKMGNKVLSHYAEQRLVCAPSLKLNLFTTGGFDNIDHNPSSTTEEDSFSRKKYIIISAQNS